jgi:hypothetical protein
MTEQQFDDLMDLIAWHLPESYPCRLREAVRRDAPEELDRSADRWSLALDT